jgi:hypothetical protein
MISYALTKTNENNVQLIKGSYYNKDNSGTNLLAVKRKYVRKKVVVFDLDETIGHFSHLQAICKCLVEWFGRELFQDEFNTMLDLFPEFFRPGIFTILDFLYNKKHKNELFKLYIYTNNQCNPPWVNMIVHYIERELGIATLFDKTICAFKIKNQVVEIKRTTGAKTYSDFIQCTMLPEDTVETCFIDNTYHDKMCGDRIYYILPKAYYHLLSKSVMVKRVVAKFGSGLMNLLMKNVSENNYVSSVNEGAITKKIMYYVREFLYYPKIPRTNKTKRVSSKKSGTKKIHKL